MLYVKYCKNGNKNGMEKSYYSNFGISVYNFFFYIKF